MASKIDIKEVIDDKSLDRHNKDRLVTFYAYETVGTAIGSIKGLSKASFDCMFKLKFKKIGKN